MKENPTDGSFLYIQDNGKDIEQEAIPKLFVPFFTTKSKGTGIGLVVCAKIVEVHDGKVEVESVIGEGPYLTLHNHFKHDYINRE